MDALLSMKKAVRKARNQVDSFCGKLEEINQSVRAFRDEFKTPERFREACNNLSRVYQRCHFKDRALYDELGLDEWPQDPVEYMARCYPTAKKRYDFATTMFAESSDDDDDDPNLGLGAWADRQEASDDDNHNSNRRRRPDRDPLRGGNRSPSRSRSRSRERRSPSNKKNAPKKRAISPKSKPSTNGKSATSDDPPNWVCHTPFCLLLCCFG